MSTETPANALGKTKPYNIRLTRNVVAAAAEKAQREGTSLAKVIDRLLLEWVGQDSEFFGAR